MKTITLDYEIYEKELKEAFEKGQGGEAFKQAKEIIRKIVSGDYSLTKQQMLIWLRDNE